jgi:hypothetical protein
MAKEYLTRETEEDRAVSWDTLKEAARKRLDIWNAGWNRGWNRGWNEGRKEGLRGVQSGTRGGSPDMHNAEERDSGGRGGLDARELVSDRTRAMMGAMSALFALIGDKFPEVKDFREKILPGRFLTADEAHALIASYAARTLSRRQFEEWDIPFIGHRTEILDAGPRGEEFNPVDHWMRLWVDPPGITKTVRYALTEDPNARCVVQSGAVIPIHVYLPREVHGDHVYPPWLWPGSVVDELYDLSVELASAFDWPLPSVGNLSGTRPRSESAALFILTGEAPPVRPIEARWETKRGSTSYLNPQWRIQLTIPPWLPEEEVVRAFRLLRRERPKGRKLPKEARTLEVARFVWERERLDGYHGRPPWKAWFERWNEENPGHRFKSYNNFREYFVRADARVKGLNFGSPEPRFGGPDTT